MINDVNTQLILLLFDITSLIYGGDDMRYHTDILVILVIKKYYHYMDIKILIMISRENHYTFRLYNNVLNNKKSSKDKKHRL